MFRRLNDESKHQFRVPTGVGKGYVMMAHIYHSILETEQSKFAIASHRLSLNNQHLRDLINYFIDFKLVGKVKFLADHWIQKGVILALLKKLDII
jgi:hypothetical protein